jgi:hypothetical protein
VHYAASAAAAGPCCLDSVCKCVVALDYDAAAYELGIVAAYGKNKEKIASLRHM